MLRDALDVEAADGAVRVTERTVPEEVRAVAEAVLTEEPAEPAVRAELLRTAVALRDGAVREAVRFPEDATTRLPVPDGPVM